jgi:hypothetical protein
MLLTKVRNRDTCSVFEIDEDAGLCDMERACPTFFRVKHGSRETYSVYRGCLIVRNTVRFTHRSVRMTEVYLFCKLEGQESLFCVSAGSDLKSIRHAKRFTDLTLDGGEYFYGIGQ